MTLTTDVTLTKDVEFQVKVESKEQVKRMVNAILEDFQTFSEDPKGDKLFETLKVANPREFYNHLVNTITDIILHHKFLNIL